MTAQDDRPAAHCTALQRTLPFQQELNAFVQTRRTAALHALPVGARRTEHRLSKLTFPERAVKLPLPAEELHWHWHGKFHVALTGKRPVPVGPLGSESSPDRIACIVACYAPLPPWSEGCFVLLPIALIFIVNDSVGHRWYRRAII